MRSASYIDYIKTRVDKCYLAVILDGFQLDTCDLPLSTYVHAFTHKTCTCMHIP